MTGELVDAPVLMAFGSLQEAAPVRHELQALEEAGHRYPVRELDQSGLRAAQPLLSSGGRHALVLDGQRYLQPLDYTRTLAKSVVERGAVRRLSELSAAGWAGTLAISDLARAPLAQKAEVENSDRFQGLIDRFNSVLRDSDNWRCNLQAGRRVCTYGTTPVGR